MTYIDQAVIAIRAELAEDPPERTPGQLMRLYAVLMLAKGPNVSAEDVHNAWAAWMQETRPDHPDLRPFAELDQQTRAADEPFVVAIRRAAQKMRAGLG